MLIMNILRPLVRCMLLLPFILIFSCGGGYRDQEGNSFKAVKIGNHIWMSENLNVAHFRNGDEVPSVKSAYDWQDKSEGGKPVWCFQGNDPGFSKKFGRLYNWYAVNDSRGLAPKGWHVATDDDWKELTDFFGGEVSAALQIRTSGYGKDSTDNSAFAGLPGGACNADGTFYGLGISGLWWTSTEVNNEYAWARQLNYIYCNITSLDKNKLFGFSVRCVKD